MDFQHALKVKGILLCEDSPLGTITLSTSGVLLITQGSNQFSVYSDGKVEARIESTSLSSDDLDRLAGWALKIFSLPDAPQIISYGFQDKTPFVSLTSKELSARAGSQRTSKTLKGIPCSQGIAEGISYQEILICKDPRDVKGLENIKGIISENGNLLSHLAITARELKIPCVMNVEQATTRIPKNSRLTLNGTNGEIAILD